MMSQEKQNIELKVEPSEPSGNPMVASKDERSQPKQIPAEEFKEPSSRVEVKLVTATDKPIETAVFEEKFDAVLDSDQINLAFTKLVDSSEQVSNRRHGTNSFFQALNTALVGAIVFALSHALEISATAPMFWTYLVVAIGISILGSLLCKVWCKLLENYELVSKSKIELMKLLESKQRVRAFSAQYILMGVNDYGAFSVGERQVADIFFWAHVAIGVLCVIVGILY